MKDAFDIFTPPPRGRFGDGPQRAEQVRKSDIIDLTVALYVETKPGKPDEGAIRVSDSGDDAKAVWLPKSQVEIERKGRMKGADGRHYGVAVIALPQWLARDKGLI